MNARAHHNIGRTSPELKKAHQCWQQGVEVSRKQRWGEAIKLFERACKSAPSDSLYRLNLARALAKDHRFDDALEQANLILARDPAQTLARRLAGECLNRKGASHAAADLLLGGRDEAKGDFEYLEVLGQALHGAGRFREAIGVLMDAIALKVDHAHSFYQLAMCFYGLNMRQEAVECLETVQVLGLVNGELACDSLLAFLRRECCDWDKASSDLASLIQRVAAAPDDQSLWLSVFGAVTLTDDPAFQLKAAQICARHMAAAAKPMHTSLKPTTGRVLKLGFVSADFHQHATTILMAELLERLDATRFEVHLYSHGPDDGSPMRRRVQAAAKSFVEVSKLSDHEVAQQIHADGIDVLVDLKGHTSRSRLGIFAWRPAPVQVSYLGFPGTTGADYIDYMIGDATVSPLAHAADFSEKLALMPITYQPNDRQRPLPQPTTRAAHGLPEDAVVLCGFNQPFKISTDLLDHWCSLMQELPGAVLWLLRWNEQCEAPLREAIGQRGIAQDRVVFAPPMRNAEHITRFALADIYLDAWPCNGHTTVSDALWSGVPVVTLQGRTFVARVAASLLRAVGQPQCITTDVAAYRAKVLELARQPALRHQLRAELVLARQAAPLFDTDRYTHDFGQLMVQMVARAEAGLPPDHIVLAASPQGTALA